MALPLQIEPMITEWAPRPVRLHVVPGGRRAGHRTGRPAGPFVRADDAVYRRRRLAAAVLSVLAVAAFALAVGVGVAVLGGSPASAPESRPATVAVDAAGTFGGQVLVPGGVYVAQPGDTLWALARALQPEGDVSSLVHRLVRLNGGPELAVGDQVALPG